MYILKIGILNPQKSKPTEKDDWVLLDSDKLNWYVNTKGYKQVNIKCPARSLVLWDSRTMAIPYLRGFVS